MWTLPDTRCLILGHIVTDFTHRGTAYRMCHRCGKIMELAAVPVLVATSPERALPRSAAESLVLSKINR